MEKWVIIYVLTSYLITVTLIAIKCGLNGEFDVGSEGSSMIVLAPISAPLLLMGTYMYLIYKLTEKIKRGLT